MSFREGSWFNKFFKNEILKQNNLQQHGKPEHLIFLWYQETSIDVPLLDELKVSTHGSLVRHIFS